MRSLRFRLMLGFIVGSIILLLVSGWMIHGLVSSAEIREFDANLNQFARQVSIIAEQERDGVIFEWDQLDPRNTMRRDPSDGNGHLFTIVGKQTGLVATNTDVFPNMEPLPVNWDQHPAHRNIVLPDGSRARAVSFGFSVRLEEDETEDSDDEELEDIETYHLDRDEQANMVPEHLAVTVVRRTAEIDQLLSRVHTILWMVGIPVALLGATGMYLLMHFSLRGLVPVRRQLETLAEGDLSHNLEAKQLPLEFIPLIKSINGLTDGLKERIDREKRFVAAAAHELRTPIATVQSNLELALKQEPVKGDNCPQARALDVTKYMSKVVERLLTFHRLDHHSYQAEVLSIDVISFLRESFRGHASALDARRVSLGWRVPDESSLMIEADPILLSLIVGNLFANIAAYATPSSSAVVEIDRAADGVQLRFTNRTSSENVTMSERLGEPFWRGDRVRNIQDQHVGLGLAIAKAAALQMNADLALHVRGDCFEAVLILE